MTDDPRSRRRRLGIPQPEWGDNVVSADFSRGRNSAAARGKAATGAKKKRSRRPDLANAEPEANDQETPNNGSESWAAGQIMRTATSLADSARLSRGRTYFRGGNVTHLTYELGQVDGLVSGTQLEPFEVQVRWRVLSARQVDFIVGECNDQPENLRLLMAGQRPLSSVASVLFGVEHYIGSSCTCPDNTTFCKHRVCLAYALAAEFTDSPETFLAWRGIDMRHLVDQVMPPESTAGSADVNPVAPGQVDGAAGTGTAEAEQPTYTPAEFWGDPAETPQSHPLEVEFGINLGDAVARDAALRRISWNNSDQLRVLDSLNRCYEALTVLNDDRGGPVFEREPWMSGPGDSSGKHD